MVASIGGINPTNVEATAYISAVAAFAVVVLLVLLFLGRRWCYSAVFTRKCCDDILKVNAQVADPCLSVDNAQFDALSKPNHYPERIFTFEASDSDEELRLRIQQDKEEVECHYEEKNENVPTTTKVEVQLVETALRETSLRETKIDEVVPKKTEYIHTLEAQSSVDSDIIAHNDTSLLCGESNSSSERGAVELTLLYDAPVRSMTVHVLQARSLPQKTQGQVLQSQARIVLLPLKKQKYKSKIRNGENPQYMESFVLHKINPEDVHGLGLRIRIYGCERMRRQRLLGEAAVSFAALNLELENNLWLQLTPRQHHQPSLQVPKLELESSVTGVLASPSSITAVSPGGGEACSLARSDSASSCCSARSAPELLLGLQYNSTTGHLSVEVIKGTHFRKLSPNKAPDTYVKLCLISSLGMEMGRCKSTTRRAQSNPLYKELFIFQVALFQLTEVTLMVSVWWRRSVKRNEMVGWFSLGHSSSGREEERHWQELCERQGEQVSFQVQRWHVLLDS
ncbi:synaptotagmin-16 [Battus philenor]|uniref:synaptotagmin-16 n=1 Tax=Battus philenor TaxID=42288 RepID=UPI0035D00214